MNNYYTLIYLIREWKEKLIGASFDISLSTRKNILELFFEKNETKIRLVFSSNPQKAALFIDRYQVPKRQNTSTFFEDLHGDTLTAIRLAEADRFVQFMFSSGRELIFLLYSNHANSILVSEGRIEEAFKKDKQLSGQPAPVPAPVSIPESSEIRKINDLIASVDPLLPRNIVRGVLTHTDITENTDSSILKVKALRKSLLDRAYPHYSDEIGFSIVDPEVLGLSEVKHFNNVNEAIAYSFYRWVKFQDFETKKRSVVDRVQKSIARTYVAISELTSIGDANEKVGLYEKYGHLLMASPNVVAENGFVYVIDFYEVEDVIKIKVDPLKTMVENAQNYYQKSRSVRKTIETYSKRLADFKHKASQLEVLLNEIEGIQFARELEKWLKANENALKRIGYSEADSVQTADHFRSYIIGNYEIRVGKNATSNDELLRISKKDDLWLHARGVSGSHVVIPMNKNQQLPPPNVMEYAAGLAAFFSKAKGSSLVPVIFTKRKYVRKSKGMAPGAVFVDKEEVLLVPPFKPDEINADN